MNRRHFLGASFAATPPGLSLAQFPERRGKARMHVGLAAYSFRDQFAWSKGKTKTPVNGEIDMFGFLDYCAEHGCHGGELTSYFFPADADRVYFHRLKRHAFLRGVDICGTAIGNNFSLGPGKILEREVANAKQWLDKAVLMGAPHVRFFAGTGKGFAAGGERVEAAIAAVKDCAEYAGERGIFIGIENHGGITAELLMRLVKEVDSPWVGINLDSGNFISEDPYANFERCAPLAVNVQLKTHMRGSVRADLPRLIGILAKAKYQGYVVLEYEHGKPEEIPDYLATLRKLCASI
jgi:sugar phosphate isomerase/epimerase